MTSITLKPSPILTRWLLILHTGALLCIILSDAPWWLKISTLAICLYSAWNNIRKYALLSHPKSVTEYTILPDGRWQLKNHLDEEQTVFLLGDSYQSRWILILNFKSIHSKKRISILLLNDMLKQPLLRRLRVYLNFSAETHA